MKIRWRGLRSPWRARRPWRRPDALSALRWLLAGLELAGVLIVFSMLFVLGVIVLTDLEWDAQIVPASVLLVGGAALALFCPIAVDEVAMWQRRRKTRLDDDQS